MSILLVIAGAGAIVCGCAISGLLLRESTVGELRILIDTDTTSSIIEQGWGEEEFPSFFRAEWSADTRESYIKLMKKMRGEKYGKSRRLLRMLIRIEDEREAGKSRKAMDDAEFTKRMQDTVSEYKRNEDFSGFLAAFIEKRHMERM